MSNLKLPSMTFENLTKLVGKRYQKTIAHNTTATIYGDKVAVYYHGNHIADVFADRVYLTTAGWATQTTTARLHAILRDNFAETPLRVAIREGAVCLVDIRDKKVRHYFREITVYANGLFSTSHDLMMSA